MKKVKPIINPDITKNRKNELYVGKLSGGFIAERHDVIAEGRGSYVSKPGKGKGSYKRKDKNIRNLINDTDVFYNYYLITFNKINLIK
jgi:hypothetical protein